MLLCVLPRQGRSSGIVNQGLPGSHTTYANCKNRNGTRAQQDAKIENTPEWHQEDAGPLTQTKSHSSSNHSGYFEKDQTGMVPVLRIFLKTSKTDREFKGVHIFVGKTGDDLCPVAAVTAFLAVWGNSPGPMFQFKDRTPLTKQRFIFHIRSALQSAGIDPTQYAGHSFRIGAATTAADVNANSYRARTN